MADTSESRAADRLLACTEKILELWEERVREEIPAAADERQPILINTLPAILRHLAEALSPRHPRASATSGNSVAEEHGGERVRVTRFRLQDVMTEYKLLREVVLAVLEEQAPLSVAERQIIHGSIDQATIEACTAYVLVQEGFREQLFAILAHDLRGPLSAAKVNISLVLRKSSSEEVPRWAARAIEGIDRVDRMVQDLLDVMRAQAGARLKFDLEECDLVQIARQCVENLQAVHGDRFVLVATAPVRGHFAPEPLRRAIENLGSNAVKYGAPSRPVTITVREIHQRAIVSVHNEGPAIPADQRETLFRAFHRLPGAQTSGQRGWGLGLAQVRGVAEGHGGSIGVDSLPGSGTTFTIDVPLDARPFQSAPTTP